jgi:hypothetical protein
VARKRGGCPIQAGFAWVGDIGERTDALVEIDCSAQARSVTDLSLLHFSYDNVPPYATTGRRSMFEWSRKPSVIFFALNCRRRLFCARINSTAFLRSLWADALCRIPNLPVGGSGEFEVCCLREVVVNSAGWLLARGVPLC